MRKEKADLRSIIETSVSPFRGVLYFAKPHSTPAMADVIGNAGFGLVDTGEKKLLVTCNHVWQGFQDARREDASLMFFLCLDLVDKRAVSLKELEPFDQDKELDLVVFDMGPYLSQCRGRKFFAMNHNPAPPTKAGDRIIVLGNQGMNRRPTDQELEFGNWNLG